MDDQRADKIEAHEWLAVVCGAPPIVLMNGDHRSIRGLNFVLSEEELFEVTEFSLLRFAGQREDHNGPDSKLCAVHRPRESSQVVPSRDGLDSHVRGRPCDAKGLRDVNVLVDTYTVSCNFPTCLLCSLLGIALASSRSVIRMAFVSHTARCEVAAEAFVLRGGEIERQPDGDPIAFGGDGSWEVQDLTFPRAEFHEVVACLFEEDGEIGERQGPFRGVAVFGGVMRSDRRVIATLRGNYWYSIATHRAWPRVRVVEAPERAGD